MGSSVRGPDPASPSAVTTVLARDAGQMGQEALELMRRLFPLCRSLTGDGVRATLDVIEQQIPITRTEVASGTRVFDWTVPDEWNIRAAHITAPDGTRVVDFADSSLHVVSYSEPVRATLPLEELLTRLHTLPDAPDAIPYRTSYYHRTWGFCIPHRQLGEFGPGNYEVLIDSTLEAGHLTYGELRLEGSGPDEMLLSTYICHPALANDNLSGIAILTIWRASSRAATCGTRIASSLRPERSGHSPGCTTTAMSSRRSGMV